jgi:hypothetical protein
MTLYNKINVVCLVAAILSQLMIIVDLAMGLDTDHWVLIDIAILTPMNIWTMWLTTKQLRQSTSPRKPKARKNIGPRQEWLP